MKQKEKASPTGKDAGPAKPTYLHMQAPPTAQGPSAPPSQTGTEGKGSGVGERKEISSKGVDPAKVAEKVYQLMLEEARDAKRRGLN